MKEDKSPNSQTMNGSKLKNDFSVDQEGTIVKELDGSEEQLKLI